MEKSPLHKAFIISMLQNIILLLSVAAEKPNLVLIIADN
jgi:hypothetical protein